VERAATDVIKQASKEDEPQKDAPAAEMTRRDKAVDNLSRLLELKVKLDSQISQQMVDYLRSMLHGSAL